MNSEIKNRFGGEGGGYRFTGFLRTAVIHFGGIAFGGGPYRFTGVLLMSLNFMSACSWLLHDNKSGRSYELRSRPSIPLSNLYSSLLHNPFKGIYAIAHVDKLHTWEGGPRKPCQYSNKILHHMGILAQTQGSLGYLLQLLRCCS